MHEGKPNRLGSSMSPYLLQHADNPVDWYPWGDEAFAQAKAQDKPVFLSIGYSSCHWCHVMAHECFEDREVAALMNEAFISIKLDREELPHIDHVYMKVCQLMTGSGGWPLTIIMTPDREPFFAATYLPKHAKHGLKGMMELIPLIRHAWENNRGELMDITGKVLEAANAPMTGQGGGIPREEIIHKTFASLSRMFQPDTGGFGTAPKFPSAHHLMFLLRYHHLTGEARALAMVEKTLDAMRRGGIYDHVGHGFHRYATDNRWRIPHFEKMLYDQALLALAYTEAFLVTGKETYRKTAREVLDFVLREMREENGLFISALDADVEGEEGGSYVWTESELKSILDSEDERLFAGVFAIETGGNFPQEPGRGLNILYMRESIGEAARRLGMPTAELQEAVDRICRTLLEVRDRRVPPLRDDKALTDWNGLMIAALARAGAAFGEPRYTEAACAAADFILEHMRDGVNRLLHAYRGGRKDHHALLDDYAFLIWGLIEIYQESFKTAYLEAARSLMHEADTLFLDRERGGFFITPGDMDMAVTRPQEFMDNALPSGNSVAFSNLLRLSRLTGETGLEETALGIARAASGLLSSVPAASTFLAAGILLAQSPSREVVIAGPPDGKDTKSLLDALRSRFLPDAVIALAPGGQEEGIPEIARGKGSSQGKAAAYVCQGSTCHPPVTDPRELLDLLSRPS